MYHILFLLSSFDCFNFVAIMNNAAMNICLCTSLAWNPTFLILGYRPRSNLWGHMIIPGLTSWGLPNYFVKWLHHFPFPPEMHEGFNFFTFSSTLAIVSFFNFFFLHLYWSIIALQWRVSFCFKTKWISYTYTYVPIFLPSCISLPPTLPIPPL